MSTQTFTALDQAEARRHDQRVRLGCVRSKKRSCASCQSCTDSKPSPSSRANCTSISPAGITRTSVTSTIARRRPLVLDHENGRRAPALHRRPRRPRAEPGGGGLLAAQHGVDEPAPELGAAASRARTSRQLRQRTSASSARLAEGLRLALDVALVPEREREQAPELAGQVLLAGRRGGRSAPSRPRAGRSPAGEASPRRASRARTARARRAARPRPGSRSRASCRGRSRSGTSGATALRSSTFLRSPRTRWRGGSAKREVRHDRVEERHASLERVRHRRAVGLHEQVVDEIDAEVDVLQPREQLGALRLGEARAVEVDRVERRCGGRSARARSVRREDLLPAVMALERRQMRGADEALGLVVEARAGGRGRKPLDQRPRDARETGRRARRGGRRRTCSSRRRARRRPRRRARP